MDSEQYWDQKYNNIYDTLLLQITKFILPINKRKDLGDLYNFIYKFRDYIHDIDIHFDNYCSIKSSIRKLCTQTSEFIDGTKIKHQLSNYNKIIIPKNAYQSSIIIQQKFRQYKKNKLIKMINLTIIKLLPSDIINIIIHFL